MTTGGSSDVPERTRPKVRKLKWLWVEKRRPEEEEDDELVGPTPLARVVDDGMGGDWGGALRPGEGDAIAQYVQAGKRIPRRGEVGLSAEEIEALMAEGRAEARRLAAQEESQNSNIQPLGYLEGLVDDSSEAETGFSVLINLSGKQMRGSPVNVDEETEELLETTAGCSPNDDGGKKWSHQPDPSVL